mmetsp:Transcript_13659/g.24730  ORF Transcript_13659/g.24730 Transcript_13659/m.24730 type:complete len:149 (+) Transcript_13659:151-597(+)
MATPQDSNDMVESNCGCGDANSSPQGSSSSDNKTVSPIRAPIKSAVGFTNATLADVEEAYHNVKSEVMPNLEAAATTVQAGAQHVVTVYEKRRQYGPAIIGGTAVVMGGLVTLRRGKVPGAFVGALSAAGAYVGVYGSLEDFSFGKKD